MSFERSNIERMKGYMPGEQSSAEGIIKLNTNENPYPASPQVSAALQSIVVDELRRYPAPLANGFRNRAAELHGVKAENILPTNGGDELLRLAITTFVEPDQSIAVSRPSYSLYPVLAEIHGCEIKEIPLLDDWSMPADFAEQLIASGAKMAIVVNPHAPTGILLPVSFLADLADRFPGVLIIDEAYVDFIDPDLGYDSISLTSEHNNVLLLRSLSKGYSLAGLRFGYGIGSKELIDPMMFKTRDSYNTDYISQQLATSALDSVSYARKTWESVRKSRNLLKDQLAELGLNCTPSQSNFLLCQIPDSIGAESLYQQLKGRNILVRYFDQDRLRDKLRISIGTEKENSALKEAIKEILS
jgi:histidinol-phosphate aminotransferase